MSGPEPSAHDTSPNEQEAAAGVVQWCRELPIWMQDALRRLYQYGTLTPADDDELLAICAGVRAVELQSASVVEPNPLNDNHVPDERRAENPIALLELRDLQHVNAVAPNQKLGFARTGLTIVYGDNGSGKSGYVRVLKRACRARHREGRLLPNVYADTPPDAATATIRYSVNQNNREHRWTDADASAPADLSRISVFDSRCAEVHAMGKNELAYTPRALAVLSELARAAQRLKAKLQQMERQADAAKPSWKSATPKPFHENTTVGRLMNSLSSNTTVGAVDALAQVMPADEQRLDQLRADLAESPTRVAQRLRGMLQHLDSVTQFVETTAEKLSADQCSTFRKHLVELVAKREAARIATEGRANDDPVAGVGSETWRTLWEAARKFSETEAYTKQVFPVTGDEARCVLCQQALSPEAGKRLSGFEEFVRDETQRQAQAAAGTVNADRAALREIDLSPKSIRAARDHIKTEHGERDLGINVRRYLVHALRRQRAQVRAETAMELDELAEVEQPPLAELAALREALNNRIVSLTSGTDSESRKTLEAELHELEDRAWLKSSRDAVLSELDRLDKLTKLAAAIGDTGTNRVTRHATTLAASLVTAKLRDSFAHEVEKLGIGRLRAEMSQLGGSTGDSTYGITLIRSRGTNVGDVFSEGELRCIALAAFLAELATADELSGIVFDDPVSSLDHNHRAAVAKRLAEAALTRQVVIFTHDIVFLCELDEAARERGLDPKYQCITRGPEVAGFATSELPHNKQPPQRALPGIESHLSNTKRQHEAGQQAEWTRTAKSIAGQIRDCWELAAEDALKPVMTRFSHKTAPSKFQAITVFDAVDAAGMADGYKRCSEWAHTQGPAAQAAPPTPDELGAEINRIRAWLARVEAKQSGLR